MAIYPEIFLQHIAAKKQCSISEAITLVENYIYYTKGVITYIADPNPIHKFEKAVTVASAYFLSI